MPYNYSIIIPCRDRLELLQAATATIPDREDIQIIIVDNSNESMTTRYERKHLKARIDYQTSSPTKGAGCARNEGLKHVLGRYIIFMDADDLFTPNAFDEFDRYLDSGSDLVYFGSTSMRLSTGEVCHRHMVYTKKIERYLNSGDEAELRYNYSVPWSKMYRAEYIRENDIYFDEVRASNDLMFSLVAGHKAKSIRADKAVVYVVTEGEVGQSLVKTRNRETMFCRYEVAIRKNLYLKKHGHYDQRERILGYLRVALHEFGIAEMTKYLRIAIKNGLTIF